MYLEVMFFDVFRIEISRNSAPLMPPRGILKVISFVAKGFWTERARSPGLPVLRYSDVPIGIS